MTQQRFYAELASWWPLISPVGEYAEEAAFAASLLRSGTIKVRQVLELGSGGGHNAAHLKRLFGMTLVDLSPDMLAVSRQLNPECEHRVGDMRNLRLGRVFDAVFVHDAIDYLTSEGDLARAVETAFVHCRQGGVAVFMPDDTAETFEPTTEHGGGDGADGRGARYLEWRWDPDPADTWVRSEYVFLLRHADERLELAHETHRTGLFRTDAWLRVLTQAGFRAEPVTETTTEERRARQVFVAHRDR